MNMTDFFTRYRIDILLVVATVGITLLLVTFSALRFPNDDQFIGYRYIDNIASGTGFVYNADERVLGATAPLFILTAALGKAIFPMVETWNIVAGINIIFLSIGTVLFYRLGRELLPLWLSLTGALVFAFDLSRTIPEGMESPLFIALTLGFLLSLLKERYFVSAGLLGLMILTRPDALLIGGLALIYWIQKSGWRDAVHFSALTGAMLLPWMLFALWYFGSAIPQSVLTKLHAHEIYNIPTLQALKVQAAAISRIFWGKIFDPNNLALQSVFNLAPLLALIGLGAWKKFSSRTWIIFAIPILYFIAFSIANPIMFPWYISEMEPLWLMLALLGVAALCQIIHSRYSAYAACAILLAGPVFGWVSLALSDDRGSKVAYMEAGQYIAEHMKAGDRVGLSDIGIVGYTTKAYIIDFIGLTNRTSFALYPVHSTCEQEKKFYMVPPAAIVPTMPEWIVQEVGQMDDCFLMGGWFTEHYELVFSSDRQQVWKLRD